MKPRGKNMVTSIVATRSMKDGKLNDSKRYWKFDLDPFSTENPTKDRPITGSVYVSKEKFAALKDAKEITVTVKL